MASISEFDTLPSSFFEWNAPWLEAGTWAHTLLSVVGLLLTFCVIMSSIRQTCTPSLLLLLLLCWADLLLCASIVSLGSNDIMHRRFSAGKTGCLIYSCLCLLACYTSITAVSAVSLERYFSICHGRNMTRKTAWLIITVILVSGLVLTLWPIVLGQYDVYALQPSLQVCVLGFWNRNPYAVTQNIICLIIILAGACAMVVSYGLIFRAFSESRKNIPMTAVDSTLSDVKFMQDAKRKESERKLLIKCVAISGLYLTCWLPYAVKAFYEIATARPIEQFPDYWCAVSALSNSALNPIFLMAFDSRIRANVIKMFSGNSDSI